MGREERWRGGGGSDSDGMQGIGGGRGREEGCVAVCRGGAGESGRRGWVSAGMRKGKGKERRRLDG